ncbi:MAG: hypothetical protein AAB290_06245, partial [Candidatus Eisenbacteria bacterium]
MRVEEPPPVVARDLAHGGDDLVVGVGLHHRAAVSAAVEAAAEVIERPGATAPAADERVGLQPQQDALVVGIGAPAPGFPRVRRAAEELGGHRRVEQRSPLPTAVQLLLRCGVRQRVTRGGGVAHTAARPEHEAEVMREADEIDHRPGRAVLARQPLRVDERERPRGGGDR